METKSGFMGGLIIGALIGFGLGIVLAPRSGQETRDQLKEKAQAVTERLKSNAVELGERMRESAEGTTSKGQGKPRGDDILRGLGRDG